MSDDLKGWGVFVMDGGATDLASMEEGEDAVFSTREEAEAWREKNQTNGRTAEIVWTEYGWWDKADWEG
ncbi:hypothetical protein EBZ39_08725 [bacterium]|nr:hypothetical protein [bacterium]